MSEVPESRTRRELLSGLNPGRNAAKTEDSARRIPRAQPSAGITVCLTTRAMACDFSVIMNPGPTEQIEAAGKVLEAIHAIEAWLSIYRDQSELSVANRLAAMGPHHVRGDLFELLQTADELYHRTDGAFDLGTGALSRLWKSCRQEQRIPLQPEIDGALKNSGLAHVDLDSRTGTIAFRRPGILLDPGAIGKGYALDEARSLLHESQDGPGTFLLHGGHSSLLAFGGHNCHVGWPIGLGNPLFTEKRLATLLLCNMAMATSGSNIQFFRHDGRRYGHILDPRTGWPVEGMLSVTVLAPSAAVADALATAFFVMGVEKARVCCENWPEIGAILIPFPEQGRKVQPVVIGIPPELIVWDEDQVIVP